MQSTEYRGSRLTGPELYSILNKPYQGNKNEIRYCLKSQVAAIKAEALLEKKELKKDAKCQAEKIRKNARVNIDLICNLVSDELTACLQMIDQEFEEKRVNCYHGVNRILMDITLKAEEALSELRTKGIREAAYEKNQQLAGGLAAARVEIQNQYKEKPVHLSKAWRTNSKSRKSCQINPDVTPALSVSTKAPGLYLKPGNSVKSLPISVLKEMYRSNPNSTFNSVLNPRSVSVGNSRCGRYPKSGHYRPNERNHSCEGKPRSREYNSNIY